MKMRGYAAPSLTRENSWSSSPSDVRNHYHSFGASLKTGCRKTMAGALETSAVRHLAAVLAADVAGYSRLMGRNEEGTLERLMAHRRIVVEPKISEHHGRIVKTAGDGILAEFASVVNAVRCLVEIAARHGGAQFGCPDHRAAPFSGRDQRRRCHRRGRRYLRRRRQRRGAGRSLGRCRWGIRLEHRL